MQKARQPLGSRAFSLVVLGGRSVRGACSAVPRRVAVLPAVVVAAQLVHEVLHGGEHLAARLAVVRGVQDGPQLALARRAEHVGGHGDAVIRAR